MRLSTLKIELLLFLDLLPDIGVKLLVLIVVDTLPFKCS